VDALIVSFILNSIDVETIGERTLPLDLFSAFVQVKP